MDKEELKQRNASNFKSYAMDEDQVYRATLNREYAEHYANLLVDNCPPSRELSLALTNLEQVMFWANAAIARNPG